MRLWLLVRWGEGGWGFVCFFGVVVVFCFWWCLEDVGLSSVFCLVFWECGSWVELVGCDSFVCFVGNYCI